MSRTSGSSRAEWAKRVERWRDSGLTAREFGAETGLNPSTLLYWSSRLNTSSRCKGGVEAQGTARRSKSNERRSAAPQPRFVEVSPVAAASSSPAKLEVVLRGGAVVRVPVDFDDTTLSRVVSVLEAVR